MSLGVGGLVCTVPVGLALPGVHGLFATVADVPLGRDGVAEATVELELLPVPLLVVDVLGVLVEVVLPGLVEVELLGVVIAELPVLALVLLDGVHGATVVVVPVWFVLCVPPVTDPALPATAGVPCVTAGLPVELGVGCDVCNVPNEPGCVAVEPGWVVVVPGCDCVVAVPVCVPIPGLGVTVPVLCATARLVASANTDVANKILRIESCSLCTSAASSCGPLRGSCTFKAFCSLGGMPPSRRRDVAAELLDGTICAGFAQRFQRLSQRAMRVGQMRCFASILPPVP